MTTSGPILVGIDIGTTNLKAIATRPDGTILCVARRAMQIDTPDAGAAEFNLEALDRNLLAILGELIEALSRLDIPASAISGIGVASIGESFVGIDSSGQRITPCPTWYDRRTTRLLDRWNMTSRAWFDITGMVDDDIYTAYRLVWWRNASTELFDRVATWLTVADYATFLLSGAKVSSPSIAARSGLADRRSLTWSSPILHNAGISDAQLGELRPSASVAGQITPKIAEQTGLIAGTPVINAGHDHPCAGLGCGLADPGQIIDSTGTSEAIKTVVDRPLDFTETMDGSYDCYPHVVPGRYLLSGHIPSSGGLLDWLVRLLSGPAPTADSATLLWQSAAAAIPGANGILVAPFLEGTGAPLNDRTRRAEITGAGAQSDNGAILRAGVEALAGWVSINLDLFESITGTNASVLVLTGGGARNDLSNRIKAALLNKPFDIPEVEEAAGLGAALVAGLATGIFADATRAAQRGAIKTRRIEPDPAWVEAYRPLRASITAHWAKAEAPSHG